MTISSIVIEYAFYIALGVFSLLAVFNLFHLFRFGLIGYAGIFVGLLFLAIAAFLLTQSVGIARDHDWNETVTFPITRSVS